MSRSGISSPDKLLSALQLTKYSHGEFSYYLFTVHVYGSAAWLLQLLGPLQYHQLTKTILVNSSSVLMSLKDPRTNRLSHQPHPLTDR